MSRRVVWFCLLIALGGPLLSEARSAHGLAMSLPESERDALESEDEESAEVYDGSEIVTIPGPNAGLPHNSNLEPLSLDLPASLALPLFTPSDSLNLEQRLRRCERPPPTAQQRLACLQTFLF
jgi:hypothetical protein